jgi:hypothetical protein
LSSPAVAADAVAISIQAMWVAVLMIDLNAVADAGELAAWAAEHIGTSR